MFKSSRFFSSLSIEFDHQNPVMEVQIISKKLIKPSVPTPSHLRYMSLSLMDIRLSPRTVPFIFYYTPHENYHSFENVERLKARLEKSLSEILTLYYPIAGRYIKENHSINCNDEGSNMLKLLLMVSCLKFSKEKPNPTS